MKKQDVHIEYVKLPIGQRFDRASLNTEEGTRKSPIARRFMILVQILVKESGKRMVNVM